MNKAQNKQIKIYKAMNELGRDKFYIELLENCPCKAIGELRRREGELTREYQSELNSKISGRTTEEYVEENKEKISKRK